MVVLTHIRGLVDSGTPVAGTVVWLKQQEHGGRFVSGISRKKLCEEVISLRSVNSI